MKLLHTNSQQTWLACPLNNLYPFYNPYSALHFQLSSGIFYPHFLHIAIVIVPKVSKNKPRQQSKDLKNHFIVVSCLVMQSATIRLKSHDLPWKKNVYINPTTWE